MTVAPAFLMLPIGDLRPNPLNPRGPVVDTDSGMQELTDSIRSQGVLEPLVVTPDYLIVLGHRRFVAARTAGLDFVPVVIRDMSESEQVLAMLAENIQRERLNAIAEARAYQYLVDHGMSRHEIGRVVGCSYTRVRSCLALLTLSEPVADMVERGLLPWTIGFVLSDTKPEDQMRFARLARNRRMTVDQMKKAIARNRLPHSNRGGKRNYLTTDQIAASLGSPSFPERGSVCWSLIAQGYERVCRECGLGNGEGICATCPLADFGRTLLGIWKDATAP